MIGAVAFSIGVSLASVEMPALANAAPTVAGAAVLLAGYVQFTAWKTHHLACWRDSSSNSGVLPANAAAAWRHGVVSRSSVAEAQAT